MKYVQTYRNIEDKIVPVILIENKTRIFNNTLIFETENGISVFYLGKVIEYLNKDEKQISCYILEKKEVYTLSIKKYIKALNNLHNNENCNKELKERLFNLEEENINLKLCILENKCEEINIKFKYL